MKKTFSKVISVFMLIIMIFSTSVAGTTSSAASEADYVATFSIETDKKSLAKGENVVVSVNLKTNYYIYAMEIPVIYDGDVLEIQDTSANNAKSFLIFKGKMASAYNTNGNCNSSSELYEKRNSNTAYWSQKKIMDRYKIAFASWAADVRLNDGKAVMLSEEETVVSFVLKAKTDISNISGFIFLSDDFKKTETFAGGRWFCARSKTEYINSKNYVARGQTLEYISADPTKHVSVTLEDSDEKVVINKTVLENLNEYLFSGLANGNYTMTVSKDGYVSKVVNVSVTDGKVSVELKLNKLGDVNGDGKVNTIDVARVNSHAKGVAFLSEYSFACADVTGEGKVNTIDVARINSHAKGVSTLW